MKRPSYKRGDAILDGISQIIIFIGLVVLFWHEL